ncbi:5-hydroxytryptamine receptor-like [Brevipalpus obovatus]|uniref:5-hydroxytryptamine receptor-like n=1 Tax=Brevipalpus obovatus TaxID=246614 RepID=UPI003D9FA43B
MNETNGTVNRTLIDPIQYPLTSNESEPHGSNARWHVSNLTTTLVNTLASLSTASRSSYPLPSSPILSSSEFSPYTINDTMYPSFIIDNPHQASISTTSTLPSSTSGSFLPPTETTLSSILSSPSPVSSSYFPSTSSSSPSSSLLYTTIISVIGYNESLYTNESVHTTTVDDHGSSLGHPNLVFPLLISIVCGILIIATVIGNLFVMAAIWFDRGLQTMQNYLVASLAFADFMVACIVMPFSAYNEVNGGWSLGAFLCDIYTSADVLCCTASILHLVAIALDRYWAVNSVTYMHSRSPMKIFLIILAVWGIALIVSIAPILGWKDPDYMIRIDKEHRCLLSQDVGYQIFATIATFYGPLLFIMFLYWKIYKIARRRVENRPGNKSVVHVKTDESIRNTSNGKPIALVATDFSTATPPKSSEKYLREEASEKVSMERTNIDSDSSTNIAHQYSCDKVPNPKSMCSGNGDGNPSLSRPRKRDNHKSNSKREGKTARILAIITGVFIACWLPFFVYALIMPLCGAQCFEAITFSAFQWLGYLNSLLNPVIYTIFSRDFRNAFRKMLFSSRPNNR